MATEHDRDPGFCYLIRHPSGLHKIGRSIDPLARLCRIAPKSLGLQLVHHIATGDMPWLERYLHQAFSHRRVRGEWFNLTDAEIGLLISVLSADDVDGLPSPVVAQWVLNEANGFEWGQEDKAAKLPVCDGVSRIALGESRYQALVEYCRRQTVSPPPTRVVLAALDEFLERRGFWPPKPQE